METRKIELPVISSTNSRKEIIPKEKQKRVVTVLQNWMFSQCQLSFEKQKEYIKQIYENNICEENKRVCKIILQQIQHKIYGYRTQDITKKLYSEEIFIDVERTIIKIFECENRCFYCREPVLVLYEFVRDPKQWTLERIDNKFGHNKSNIEIACLNCNLHRRTMYYERYIFTKQLNIQKI